MTDGSMPSWRATWEASQYSRQWVILPSRTWKIATTLNETSTPFMALMSRRSTTTVSSLDTMVRISLPSIMPVESWLCFSSSARAASRPTITGDSGT
ncbi:Uncharacterised protein [Mycobacterium tuberculosis]|nr:Uncharacterised protein [Mycobacterium tuberculosis]